MIVHYQVRAHHPTVGAASDQVFWSVWVKTNAAATQSRFRAMLPPTMTVKDGVLDIYPGEVVELRDVSFIAKASVVYDGVANRILFAQGPTSQSMVGLQVTDPAIGLPSYFNATSAELLSAFKTGLYPVLALGLSLAFARYFVEVVRRRGSPPPES